ncbi:hypothetical protein [Natrialba sp. INN-245]|uniref:hypothetical protein n=1 Tax=Natrialba sp. INN-245 TaxID=2690967 RepID=UPI0031B6BB3C
MEVESGVLPINGMNLLFFSELTKWTVAATTEKIVGFGWRESGWTPECEVFERRFGVFFAVEDGDVVIHLRSPETVMSSAVANNVFAGNVSAVVIQRGVEGIFGSDLIDIPRWHLGASAELFFGGDLAVGAEELTNSSLMRRGRIFIRVGSSIGHTIDPTSSLVKVTI